jgi:hypothetical protein
LPCASYVNEVERLDCVMSVGTRKLEFQVVEILRCRVPLAGVYVERLLGQVLPRAKPSTRTSSRPRLGCCRLRMAALEQPIDRSCKRPAARGEVPFDLVAHLTPLRRSSTSSSLP